MEFVGRSQEMERLDGLCRRRHGGLAVLTGRRRVGKTRLLVEWNRRRGGLYTVADQSAPEIQRRYFCEALASRFPVFQEATFRDWRSILKALAQQAEADHWKGPVILDEFPFLVTSSPELPSVLQHWIDQETVHAGLVVAIAGSSQRMMHGLVLDSSAPLYGRAVEMIEVKPLRMADFTAACEPQKLCADCVALGILSLLAGMAVDDGDSRGQWRLSRNPRSPHASWRERRRLGDGHGFGQFSGRALGVANTRLIEGRTSSDLQTATLYSWCSPPRTGTARTLLAGVGRIGGSQCAPNGACMCSPR
jgi:hypothetical protein